jgi:hypothetical protein
MNRSSRHSALTLVEILVVLGIMAVLFAVGVPAVKKIVESFDSSANVRSVITAALSHARSIAMSDGTWAGLRFQQDTLGNQYMILIRYDYDATGLADGFRAVENRKPMKLPESIGVMDLIWYNPNLSPPREEPIADDSILDPSKLGDRALRNTTTFSVVFSKEGRLATHDVQVMVRDVRYVFVPPPATMNYEPSQDDIFNTQPNVDLAAKANPPKRMFYQDNYSALGLSKEPSRNSFVIYDKKKFNAVPAAKRWSLCLKSLPTDYVNPGTGELVGLR